MKWEGYYKLRTRHTVYDTGEGTVMAEMIPEDAIRMRVIYCKDKHYDPIEPTVYNLNPKDFVKYEVPVKLKIDTPLPPALPLVFTKNEYTAACKDATVALSDDAPGWVTREETDIIILVPADV
jgi:hypothetical protein